ncbi:MAG: hypothetical protein V7L20_05555 [Nostoc sp.]
MKIPDNLIIPEEKLTRYLLVPRIKDDKLKFLAKQDLHKITQKIY